MSLESPASLIPSPHTHERRLTITDGPSSAAASLDDESDKVVQRVIREEFEGCTNLTVAHRLGAFPCPSPRRISRSC